MVIYNATVFTGDMLTAGSWNNMYLQLIGTKGSGPKQHLRNNGYRDSVSDLSSVGCLCNRNSMQRAI